MKFFLMGFYGRRNFGDDVMLRELSRLLLEGADHEVVVAAGADYVSRLLDPRVQVVPRRPSTVVSMLRGSDVLIQGGGTIFHDDIAASLGRRYWINLLVWGNLFWIARFLGVKVLVLGAGVGPLRSPVTRAICWFAFAACHAIMVRDPASLQDCRRVCNSAKIVEGGDLAGLGGRGAVARPTAAAGERVTIGVIPCSLAEFDPTNNANEETWQNLATALNRLADERAIYVRMAALFTGETVKGDDTICNLIDDRLTHKAEIIGYPNDVERLDDFFRSCDVVISAKYHGAVLSFLSGAKLMTVAYNRKLADLSAQVGLKADFVLPRSPAVSADRWHERLVRSLERDAAGSTPPDRMADLVERAVAASFAKLNFQL